MFEDSSQTCNSCTIDFSGSLFLFFLFVKCVFYWEVCVYVPLPVRLVLEVCLWAFHLVKSIKLFDEILFWV